MSTVGVGQGRPRRPEVDEAVLRATIDLLGRGSFADLSIEQVARHAGVGKPAIYRRWPTKAALVVDALAVAIPEARWRAPGIHLSTGGDLRAALRGWLVEFAGVILGSGMEHVLHSVIGEAMVDPQLAKLLRVRYLEPRQAIIGTVLRQGIDAGVVRADLDLGLIGSMLFGPIMHSWLLNGAPLTPEQVGRLFDLSWSAISTD